MSEDVKKWVETVLTQGNWKVYNCHGDVHGLVKDGLEFTFGHDDHSVWMNIKSSRFQRPWQGCAFGAFQLEFQGINQLMLAGVVMAGRTRLPILVSASSTKDGKPSIAFQLGGESLSELTQQSHDGGWDGTS